MDNKKQFSNTLILLFGCPGVGKSTNAKIIKEKLLFLGREHILIEADIIECNLIHQESKSVKNEFQQEIWKKSREILFEQVKTLLEMHTNNIVIIDDDFLLSSQRKRYLHLCQKQFVISEQLTNRFKSCYIEILFDAPLSEIQWRNSNRSLEKQVDIEVLKEKYYKLERQPLIQDLFIQYNEEQDITSLILEIEIVSQALLQSLILLRSDIQLQTQQNNDNLIHQLDQTLRRLISFIMKSQTSQDLQNKINDDLHLDLQNVIIPEIGNRDVKYMNLLKSLFLDVMKNKPQNENVLYNLVKEKLTYIDRNQPQLIILTNLIENYLYFVNQQC